MTAGLSLAFVKDLLLVLPPPHVALNAQKAAEAV